MMGGGLGGMGGMGNEPLDEAASKALAMYT